MKFLGIIPARYGSTRLEGKPLADIHGKTMIQWVYEKAAKVLTDLVVATDDTRIFDAVIAFGGNAVMTSADHTTGTNRCLEALQKVSAKSGTAYDAVLNIQGDEPMLDPEQLVTLMDCFKNPATELATLVIPVTDSYDLENNSEVFVTFDKNMKALYFSRAVIPVVHTAVKEEWMDKTTFFKHVGLYGYTAKALGEFASLPQSRLETTEKLEQNRWLENGGIITVGITHRQSVPVDTFIDLERVRQILKP
jgi:3-deoxy-manno-octulosonate cytidylyltransferase (CMP-KDO synthetase)